MIRSSALLAAGFVLIAAASGSGDYALVLPERGIATGSCAKSAATCEAAMRAAWAGYLHGVPAGTPSRCEVSPGCFGAESLCIKNHNCFPAGLRR